MIYPQLKISKNVPEGKLPLVERMGNILGKTPLHEDDVCHRDSARIGSSLRIYEEYEKLKRHPAPPESPGWRKVDWRAENLAKKIMDVLDKDGHVEIVKMFDVSGRGLNVQSEHGTLRTVYMRLPHHLDWTLDGINGQEAAMQNNKPDRLLATIQHYNLIDTVLASGTKVILGGFDREMVPDKDAEGKEIKRPLLPEAVYTRDPLMVIGDVALLGNMVAEVRKPETGVIKGALAVPGGNAIEYGDLFVVKRGQVLGTSGDRTHEDAIRAAIAMVNTATREGVQWTVEVLEKVPSILHGDCVTGDIPAGLFEAGAYVFTEAYHNPQVVMQVLKKLYGKIVNFLSNDTRKLLGANVLWLNENTAIVNAAATEMIRLLQKHGKNVLALNLSEIVKGDGAGRCSSCPIERD